MWIQLPQKKGTSTPAQFLAHVHCGQTAGWIKTSLGTEVDLGPGHILLDGVPAPAKGAQQPPLFGPCLLWPRSPISATAVLLLEMHTVYTRHRDTYGARTAPLEFVTMGYKGVVTIRPNKPLLTLVYPLNVAQTAVKTVSILFTRSSHVKNWINDNLSGTSRTGTPSLPSNREDFS